MKIFFFIIFLIFTFLFSKAQTAANIFYSPNGKIAFRLTVQNSQLVYSIDYNKLPVIESSEMDLVVNGNTIAENITIGKTSTQQVAEEYAYRGVHSKSINKYNGATILLNANSGSTGKSGTTAQ